MTDRGLEINIKRHSLIVRAKETLLIIFIMLSPIYKCFEGFTIGDLNPITIVLGLLLGCYALNILNFVESKRQGFFSATILVVFCLELFLAKGENHVGWVLQVLLYTFFLQTDVDISIERIYRTFLYSSIFAAFFTLIYGFVGGEMTRVAGLVDGSIAPIAVAIILFTETESHDEGAVSGGTLKALSMVSSIIVLAFGMSRARFLIVAVCFAAYAFSKFSGIVKNGGKVSLRSVLYFMIAVLVVLVLLMSGTLQKIFEPIINRFLDEGLDSMGRDVELDFGLQLFKENVLWGGGWGQFTLQNLSGSYVRYNNHSAYIAVLARGGLFFAVPMFLSYYVLLWQSWMIRRANAVAASLMIVFLLLSYGNAGMFNYTICSIIPVVVLAINKERYDENKKYPVSAEG